MEKNLKFFRGGSLFTFHWYQTEQRFSNYVFWTSVRISYKFISTILTFESIRLTLCTNNFNIQKFCVLPTMHLCVLRGSPNKQRFFSLYSNTVYVFITEAECLLRGMNWVFKSNRYTFFLNWLIWRNELSRSELFLLSLIQIFFC